MYHTRHLLRSTSCRKTHRDGSNLILLLRSLRAPPLQLRQLVPAFGSEKNKEKSPNCARMISRALELELENGLFLIENVTKNRN